METNYQCTFVTIPEACELASRLLGGILVGRKTLKKWEEIASGDQKYDFRRCKVGRFIVFDRTRIERFILDRRFSMKHLQSKRVA